MCSRAEASWAAQRWAAGCGRPTCGGLCQGPLPFPGYQKGTRATLLLLSSRGKTQVNTGKASSKLAQEASEAKFQRVQRWLCGGSELEKGLAIL